MMLVWIFDSEWDLWDRSARKRRVCRVGDLDPGIKTLSASLFEILLRLENELVDAGGDLELGCLFRPLGVARGEERHAATVGVRDTGERRGQRRASRKNMDGLLSDRIEHAKVTSVAISLETDVDTLGGLPEGDVEHCHRQRARSTATTTSSPWQVMGPFIGARHVKHLQLTMTSSPPLGKYLASSGGSLLLAVSLPNLS